MEPSALFFFLALPLMAMGSAVGLSIGMTLTDINRTLQRQNNIKLMEIELQTNKTIEIDGNTWKATPKKGAAKDYGG